MMKLILHFCLSVTLLLLHNSPCYGRTLNSRLGLSTRQDVSLIQNSAELAAALKGVDSTTLASLYAENFNSSLSEAYDVIQQVNLSSNGVNATTPGLSSPSVTVGIPPDPQPIHLEEFVTRYYSYREPSTSQAHGTAFLRALQIAVLLDLARHEPFVKDPIPNGGYAFQLQVPEYPRGLLKYTISDAAKRTLTWRALLLSTNMFRSWLDFWGTRMVPQNQFTIEQADRFVAQGSFSVTSYSIGATEVL